MAAQSDQKNSDWHNNNGFDYRLFPAKTGQPESLIICLHAIGGHANIYPDYIRELQRQIPGADIISLQGPFKVKKAAKISSLHIADGFNWFPLGKEEGLKPQAEIWLSHIFNRMTIAKQVEAFAKAELEKRGLDETNLAYIGTSMGGIVALQAALPAKKPVAAVLTRGSAVLPFTRIKSKPPVFLQMGANDAVFNLPVPPPAKGKLRRAFNRLTSRLNWNHEHSVKRLKKDGVPVTEKIYARQPHTLDYASWKEGVEFVAKALKPSTPKA